MENILKTDNYFSSERTDKLGNNLAIHTKIVFRATCLSKLIRHLKVLKGSWTNRQGTNSVEKYLHSLIQAYIYHIVTQSSERS